MVTATQLETLASELLSLLEAIKSMPDATPSVFIFPKTGCPRTRFLNIVNIFATEFPRVQLPKPVTEVSNQVFAKANEQLAQQCEKLAIYASLPENLDVNSRLPCVDHSTINCRVCLKV